MSERTTSGGLVARLRDALRAGWAELGTRIGPVAAPAIHEPTERWLNSLR